MAGILQSMGSQRVGHGTTTMKERTWASGAGVEGRGGEHPRGKDRSHHWLSICHMPGVLSGVFCLLLQP